MSCTSPSNPPHDNGERNNHRQEHILKWRAFLGLFLERPGLLLHPDKIQKQRHLKAMEQQQEEESIFPCGSSHDDTASVASSTVHTASLNELHDDLDDTSDNLADLELDFADDLQALAKGLETVFENWRSATLNEIAERPVMAADLDLNSSSRSSFHSPRTTSTTTTSVSITNKPLNLAVVSPTGVDEFGLDDLDGSSSVATESTTHQEEEEDEETCPLTSSHAPTPPREQVHKHPNPFAQWLAQVCHSIFERLVRWAKRNQKPPPSMAETKSFLQVYLQSKKK